MFKLEIKTGGAAFHDGEEGWYDLEIAHGEIRRILNDVAEKMCQGRTEGKIMDINGNSCGSWELDL